MLCFHWQQLQELYWFFSFVSWQIFVTNNVTQVWKVQFGLIFALETLIVTLPKWRIICQPDIFANLKSTNKGCENRGSKSHFQGIGFFSVFLGQPSEDLSAKKFCDVKYRLVNIWITLMLMKFKKFIFRPYVNLLLAPLPF